MAPEPRVLYRFRPNNPHPNNDKCKNKPVFADCYRSLWLKTPIFSFLHSVIPQSPVLDYQLQKNTSITWAFLQSLKAVDTNIWCIYCLSVTLCWRCCTAMFLFSRWSFFRLTLREKPCRPALWNGNMLWSDQKKDIWYFRHLIHIFISFTSKWCWKCRVAESFLSALSLQSITSSEELKNQQHVHDIVHCSN